MRQKKNIRNIVSIGLIILAVVALAITAVCFHKKIIGLFERDKQASTGEVIASTEDTAEITAEATEATTEMSEEEKEAIAIEEQVEATLASMSLQDKICQLFVVRPETLAGGTDQIYAGEATAERMKTYPVGGLIYMSDNIVSYDQLSGMIDTTKTDAKDADIIPLFYGVDEEGGRVARCANAIGTTSFQPMYTYHDEGIGVSFSNAYTIGKDLSDLGFNLDFAPVADTWSNPANTVIGDRAYSTEYEESAELVEGAVRGFHQSGVACSVKHFPGHGDTAEDSHVGLAYLYRSQEELDAQEYLAFRSGIDAGADMVMVGHIVVPEFSDRPASLSSEITTGQLREHLLYDGVIITDGLDMGALSSYGSSPEICVQALQAGADLLLLPTDLDGSVTAINQAIEDGTLTEDRIDDSVRRILRVKIKRGIMEHE